MSPDDSAPADTQQEESSEKVRICDGTGHDRSPCLGNRLEIAGLKETLRAVALLRAALILIVVLTPGCSSSFYGWHVRTNSSPSSPTFNQVVLTQEPVAIFGALVPPGLLGTETGLDSILAQVLKTVAPSFKVVTPQETASLINRNDLADEYTRMRNAALQSHLLDRGSLKKLGTAIGARYVFQPKLTAFMQITKDRWELPPIALKVSRIRSSIMRLSLQLWDMQTGELLWTSLAEASLESEAVGQDPVYFEDTARVTMGSIIADFITGKTASSYGPLDRIIDQLIQIPQPEKRIEDGK